jgi:hypothetical protein
MADCIAAAAAANGRFPDDPPSGRPGNRTEIRAEGGTQGRFA